MIESFIKNYEYYKDVSLNKYNTYKLDIKCNYLIYPKDYEETVNLVKYLKENNIYYLFLGGGSNVIIARDSVPVAIKLDYLNKIEFNGNIITVSSGVSLVKLAKMCMDKSLYGLAFAGSIPGQVGASTAMNAGAFNESMSDIVKEVKVITPDFKIKIMKKEELDFSYRNSFLKEHKDYIVLEVTLKLMSFSKEKIKEIMLDRSTRRINSQPLDMPSAGSVFRNPFGLSAGKLIEDAGLKGYRIGGAMVSQKHANFIVNTGDANYEDIINLINLIKKTIKEKDDIDLILEQEIIW